MNHVIISLVKDRQYVALSTLLKSVWKWQKGCLSDNMDDIHRELREIPICTKTIKVVLEGGDPLPYPPYIVAAAGVEDGLLFKLLTIRGASVERISFVDREYAYDKKQVMKAESNQGLALEPKVAVDSLLINFGEKYPYCKTPLMCAIYDANPLAVERLVEAGANLDFTTHKTIHTLSKGSTYLHFAVHRCFDLCRFRVLRNSLHKFTDDSVLRKHIVQIVRSLLMYGCDINKCDSNNLSTLHYALSLGQTKLARQIVEITINSVTRKMKPLDYCIEDNKGTMLITHLQTMFQGDDLLNVLSTIDLSKSVRYGRNLFAILLREMPLPFLRQLITRMGFNLRTPGLINSALDDPDSCALHMLLESGVDAGVSCEINLPPLLHLLNYGTKHGDLSTIVKLMQNGATVRVCDNISKAVFSQFEVQHHISCMRTLLLEGWHPTSCGAHLVKYLLLWYVN